MAAKDLLVNDGRDRQAVEAVRERLPQLDVVSALACTPTTNQQKKKKKKKKKKERKRERERKRRKEKKKKKKGIQRI